MSDQIPWKEFGQIMEQRKHERQLKRLARTEQELKAKDVKVEKRFTPEHWRITVAGVRFDFWPSTGRWRLFPGNGAEAGRGGIPAMRKAAK